MAYFRANTVLKNKVI